MSETPRNLLRQQLAKFVPDPRTLRALEQALAITEQVASGTIKNTEIDTLPASAQATAAQALSQIEELAQNASLNQSALVARLEQTAGRLQEISDAVQLLALAPPVQPKKRTRSGMFLDTTTQTAAVINTAYAITYNTTAISEGVYLGSPSSRIYVDEPGRYNLQFSIQLDKTAGGTGNFWIWVAINGSDVANSASQIQIQGNNAEIFSAANFFLDLNAGDYVELKWAVSDTGVVLQYFAAAAPVPAIPSIIVTLSNNIN